jgi:RimJ/RimL family protein N-acetyltransferase
MLRAWSEDGFGPFIVVRKADGEPLGGIGLIAWDPNCWRIGIRAEIGEQAEIELGWTLSRRVGFRLRHRGGCRGPRLGAA